MTKFFLAALLLCFVCLPNGQAQTNNSAAFLKELLDLPAPPRVNPDEEPVTTKTERSEEFYSFKNIPPDDAPIEELLDYWQKQAYSYDEFRYNLKPSKKTVQRIIEEIEKDPLKLPLYIKILPDDKDTADFVKRLYAVEKQAQKMSSGWYEASRRWLRNNSDMYVEELLERAREVKEDEEEGRLTNQWEMVALAKVDWDKAKSFIDEFERKSSRSALYSLAKFVLYQHALRTENSSDTEKYRADLQKIVEDKTANYKARDLAMDALVLGGDFEGRDEWYISLLTDETLLELQENGFTGLSTLIRYSPNDREKWIPLMTKLLENGNPTQRTAAVRNLRMAADFEQKEIVRLLLPWLANPAWAKESGDRERRRLIEAVGKLDMPESIPGLIAILTNEEGNMRSLAAGALVAYKVPEAIPALRAALQSETDEFRDNIIEALIVSGGLSDDELMSGLEAFAVKLSARKTESEDNEYERDNEEVEEDTPVPVEISIGDFLKNYETPPDGLVLKAIRRVKILQKSNPAAAAILSDIMQHWKSRVVDLEMFDWATSGKNGIEIILKVLTRREEMRERIPNELSMMRGKNAISHALSVVILDDKPEMSSILRQSDAETQLALLAFARLVRAELPVGEVAALLNNPNKSIAAAAERFLETEDSLEARKIILSGSAGEARILGAKQAFTPDEKRNNEAYQSLLASLFQSVNGTNYWSLNLSELNKTENNLRAEIKNNAGLLAIYAFVSNEEYGQKVLRLYKDKIVFTFYEDDARYWEKTVTPQEYEAMYRFIIENRIDNFSSSIDRCGRECPNNEFIMFGRDGGRRIFYRDYSTPAPLDKLEEIFDSFNTGKRRLFYRLAENIAGLEVLLADENLTARAIWKNGGDFRVLVEDEAEQKKIIEDMERQEKSEDANENLTYSQRRELQLPRRIQSAFKHYSWRKFENGRLGDTAAAQPSEMPYLGENRQVMTAGNKYVYAPVPKTYLRRSGNFEIQTESFYSGDLVKYFDSGERTIFKEGKYITPVITADGKWVIAGKADVDFGMPNYVVRINARTGNEFKINIPPADEFNPVVFVPAHNKVLLYRARDEDSKDKDNPSPKTPEYYLLDAQTGAFQLVKGEFRPLEHQTFRGLQPTGNPNEFWAAIYDEKTKATQIGRYDAKAFAFKPVFSLPQVSLDSMDIWIDRQEMKLYFVYSGHLLALALPPEK